MNAFMRIVTRAAALAVAAALLAFASGTAVWEMNSYSDFIRGRFNGLSLSRDGRLSLAPKVDTVFSSDQAAIWSVAQAPDGTLYAATGHRGRVYRIDRAGKSELLWTAPQPEVFAVAVDRAGVVYAGTSPDGAVYRIENGKATGYFTPQTRYIWSLAAGADGALYVGTGEQGKIFRVDSAGKGELYYDTEQGHVTGLAVDAQGRLLAGTEPNGLLYRITGKNQAFVLYDAALPEIRAIFPMADGTIYAAALGGSVAKRAQSASQAGQGNAPANAIPTVTTSITVEAQSAEIKPPDAAKQPPPPVAVTPAPLVTTPPPPVEVGGLDKSAVYRINPDNTVETLWSSKDENVYDVLALEKQILFSTDVDGRIYGLAPDRRVTLVTQTNEGEAIRLLPSDHSVLAATSNLGRILRLGDTPGPSGSYEAPAHDAGSAARWGSLSWRAETPAGCAIAFRTRSGNSVRPDRTWSEWSAPLSVAAGSRIASPNARYIQWKVEMTGAAGATPVLENVTVAYLPRNSPPVIKSINVTRTAAPAGQSSKAAAAPSSAYSVTVTDTDPGATSSGTPSQAMQRGATDQLTLVWAAEDPDGDRLVYDVYFRGEGESQWKTLKSATRDNSITFDADILADGKYYFRVVASDRDSNPPSSAREAQLTSAPVILDNTPPTITVTSFSRDGAKARIEFEASDAASALRRCEYSVDASGWTPVEAADGVIDSQREKFTLELTGLAPGERLVALRAADSANNTGVAKVILK
jgi:hypothetical protein